MGTEPRTGFVRVDPQTAGDHSTEQREGPTLEQCENLALALGFPILVEGLRPPYYEESMRNLHALIQRALNGDVAADQSLSALRSAFGRSTT